MPSLLRLWLQRDNLTAAAAARRLKVSRATFYTWLKGEACPTSAAIPALASKTKLDPQVLEQARLAHRATKLSVNYEKTIQALKQRPDTRSAAERAAEWALMMPRAARIADQAMSRLIQLRRLPPWLGEARDALRDHWFLMLAGGMMSHSGVENSENEEAVLRGGMQRALRDTLRDEAEVQQVMAELDWGADA